MPRAALFMRALDFPPGSVEDTPLLGPVTERYGRRRIDEAAQGPGPPPVDLDA
jgi:hypothetical protein